MRTNLSLCSFSSSLEDLLIPQCIGEAHISKPRDHGLGSDQDITFERYFDVG